MSSHKLIPDDPRYPRSLFILDQPPAITTSGRLDANVRGKRVVAIVGSRRATQDARAFAFGLAYHLAKAGVVIVSGGAVGIDRAAHEGAMAVADGRGVTWLVSPAGRGLVSPIENADLFAEIQASKRSRIIWPFPDLTAKSATTPRARNGVLVALAECVIVIQAGHQSGSRNAITWARGLHKPIYVVPAEPWNPLFQGSIEAGANGAHALWSVEWMMRALDLPAPDMDDRRAISSETGKPLPKARLRSPPCPRRSFLEDPLFPVHFEAWTSEEKAVFSVLSMAPTQQDEIIVKSGLGTSSTLTALLTLSLKDVVVEGPDGFFRRRIAL